MKLTLKAANALATLVGGLVEYAPHDPSLSPEIELENDLDGKVLVSMRANTGEQAAAIGTVDPAGTYTSISPLAHVFAPPEKTHEVKAKNLRVGYEVKAPGAPAWSRISKVERDDQAGGNVGVDLPWGHMDFDPNDIVEVKAAVLHPQIVASNGVEIGVGSMIDGGPQSEGEVSAIGQPDESQWKVAVQWPEWDEPETFDACSNPRRGHESEPLTAADVEAV